MLPFKSLTQSCTLTVETSRLSLTIQKLNSIIFIGFEFLGAVSTNSLMEKTASGCGAMNKFRATGDAVQVHAKRQHHFYSNIYLRLSTVHTAANQV